MPFLALLPRDSAHLEGKMRRRGQRDNQKDPAGTKRNGNPVSPGPGTATSKKPRAVQMPGSAALGPDAEAIRLEISPGNGVGPITIAFSLPGPGPTGQPNVSPAQTPILSFTTPGLEPTKPFTTPGLESSKPAVLPIVATSKPSNPPARSSSVPAAIATPIILRNSTTSSQPSQTPNATPNANANPNAGLPSTLATSTTPAVSPVQAPISSSAPPPAASSDPGSATGNLARPALEEVSQASATATPSAVAVSGVTGVEKVIIAVSVVLGIAFIGFMVWWFVRKSNNDDDNEPSPAPAAPTGGGSAAMTMAPAMTSAMPAQAPQRPERNDNPFADPANPFADPDRRFAPTNNVGIEGPGYENGNTWPPPLQTDTYKPPQGERYDNPQTDNRYTKSRYSRAGTEDMPDIPQWKTPTSQWVNDQGYRNQGADRMPGR